MHFESNTGHLGGSLSCLDALMALHHLVLRSDDRFVLSKGHAASAHYVTLWTLGQLADADLETFNREDSLLPGHPSGTGIPNHLFSTGSLGHGPSLAGGLALAARHLGSPRRVFCLCSDGEWQEGSCWEALTFAVHHRLDNLTILIDQNGWQAFGRTEDVVSCSDLAPRLAAFGAHVRCIDGHDAGQILAGLERVHCGQPNLVVMKTIKGRGLHFADRLESHYLPLTEDQFGQACTRLMDEAP